MRDREPEQGKPGINWRAIGAAVVAVAGLVGGSGAGSFVAGTDTTDEVRELRQSVKDLRSDVKQIREVVDGLAVALVKRTDGDGAAKLATAPVTPAPAP